MKRVRLLIALLVMPLCGFTCVSISSLVVKTVQSDAGYHTTESLAADFNEVARATGEWARQNHFAEQTCRSGFEGHTLLCRNYVNERSVRVTVEFVSSMNLTTVEVTDWSARGKYLSDVVVSLKAHLSKALPSAVVRERH